MAEADQFQRWQKIAIDQLSYCLNLFFTLAVAALGYCFSLLRDPTFSPGSSAKVSMILATVMLAISALCGFGCIVNRLHDFRGTARRAKGLAEVATRDALRGLGQLTWALFYIHCSAFALGIAALAFSLLLTFGGKLA